MSKKSQARGVLTFHILMLLLVAIVVTWSMWQAPALLAGHSARKDLARLVEFDAAIRGGDFFPSWSPDLYAGYGSPIFSSICRLPITSPKYLCLWDTDMLRRLR